MGVDQDDGFGDGFDLRIDFVPGSLDG